MFKKIIRPKITFKWPNFFRCKYWQGIFFVKVVIYEY